VCGARGCDGGTGPNQPRTQLRGSEHAHERHDGDACHLPADTHTDTHTHTHKPSCPSCPRGHDGRPHPPAGTNTWGRTAQEEEKEDRRGYFPLVFFFPWSTFLSFTDAAMVAHVWMLLDKKGKAKEVKPESSQTPVGSPKASEAENALKLENAGDKATPVVKLKLSGKGITIKVSQQEPKYGLSENNPTTKKKRQILNVFRLAYHSPQPR